jgi:hypothetical protein
MGNKTQTVTDVTIKSGMAYFNTSESAPQNEAFCDIRWSLKCETFLFFECVHK